MITKKLIIIYLACVATSLSVLAKNETVELESIDGKKITAELLEKGADKIKFKVGWKTYTLPYTKFSNASVEIMKKADIPTICEFRLMGNFTKKNEEIRRSREEHYRDHEGKSKTRTITDSYRIDTISGKVTVKKLDRKEASPQAKLYVVVMSRNKGNKNVIRRQVMDLKAITPGKEMKFDVGEAKTWHSERGRSLNKAKGLTKGRYSGYIAAVVIDGRIAEVKAVPSSLEKDIDAVREFLEIPVVKK